MANPPRSMALNPPRAPDSLPIGVRAPETMTEPGMDVTSDWTVSAGQGRMVGGAPFYGGIGETAPGPGQGAWSAAHIVARVGRARARQAHPFRAAPLPA